MRFGSNTACTFTNYWHGGAHGFGNEVIDGLALGAMSSILSTNVANEQIAMNELAADVETSEEEDDHLDVDLIR